MTALPGYETDHPAAYEWTDKAFDLVNTNALTVSLVLRNGARIASATGNAHGVPTT